MCLLYSALVGPGPALDATFQERHGLTGEPWEGSTEGAQRSKKYSSQGKVKTAQILSV